MQLLHAKKVPQELVGHNPRIDVHNTQPCARERGQRAMLGSGVPFFLLFALLSFCTVFLAVSYGGFFVASSNLDLYVNRSFWVYFVAVSAVLAFLLSRANSGRPYHLFLLGAMVFLMFYATPLSTYVQSQVPTSLLAFTEPIHVGTSRYILREGHLGGQDVHYYGWPLSFTLLAILSTVLGFDGNSIIFPTFLLGMVLQFLSMIAVYALGERFAGKGVLVTCVYYLAGFYFVRPGFSPQAFGLPLVVLYIIIGLGKRPTRSFDTRLVLVLLSFALVFGHIVSTILLFCFLLSMAIVQRITGKEIFEGLSSKILIVCCATLAWGAYFVSSSFGYSLAVILGGGGSFFIDYLVRAVLSGAIGQGTPGVAPWYVNFLKAYRVWINVLVGASALLGFAFLARSTNGRVRGFAVSVGLALAVFSVFEVAFISLFENFWERIFSLSYPFAAMFSLVPIQEAMSRSKSLGGVVGSKNTAAVLLCVIVALSFFSSEVSLTKGYSTSELNTSTFVSAFDKEGSLGVLTDFYKLLMFSDAFSRAYVFDEILDHSIYDVGFFFSRQSEISTLYHANTIVRTNQEVASLYEGFGIGYGEFWGKVDHALNTHATYNRIFDSGSEQVFTTVS